MSGKRRGHTICPSCGKETDFILKRGEALVWCRKCHEYFRVYLDVAAVQGECAEREDESS